MSVISGIAYWAAITNPNTTFDPDGVWSIDVCNLDKKNLGIIEKDGLTVKNKGDDRGSFVTIKRKYLVSCPIIVITIEIISLRVG